MAETTQLLSQNSFLTLQELKSRPKLTSDQQHFLAAVFDGHSITDSARSAGISRSSVYNWMKGDPAFRNCYNQWLDHLRESCKARLVTLAETAAETVRAAMVDGNATVAMQILKGLGLLSASAEQPRTPTATPLPSKFIVRTIEQLREQARLEDPELLKPRSKQ